MRYRPLVVATLAAVAGSALVLVVVVSAVPGGGEADQVARLLPADPIAPTPQALGTPGPVVIDTEDFWSWALVDVATGHITGAPNLAETSTTASMIKVWLAADYLRLATEAGDRPREERLQEISVMIRDSENDPATRLYDELGGAESIDRLIAICGLTDSAASWRWSLTELSARDAARMGGCIADGRAAGPEWTDWLLSEMRQVRGEGDFGIREAFPAKVVPGVAIKNGYFARPEDGRWHLNCLAVGDGWALAVIQRYPEALGMDHGAAICRDVAAQLWSTG